MAKKYVFRLDKIQGGNNIDGWQGDNKFINGYGTEAINEIADPTGADVKKAITSIPSPFARIDLVKTAFREVVEGKNLDGTTIFHKMVSDSLDVAEIFFNYDILNQQGLVEIIVWDKEKELGTDTNPTSFAKNNPLGKTLKVYLKSDASAYNYNELKRIYLLNYIGPKKPSELNIIGATSPATLFFSPVNNKETATDNLSYVSENINFGTNNDRPFDGSFQPLYNRDWDFVKYLYAFKKAKDIDRDSSNFHNYFPEVNDYLELCYSKLSDDKKQEIDNLDENSLNNYEELEVGINGSDRVEILGKKLHKKIIPTDFDSDFKIDSSHTINGKTPLVLPVECGTAYTSLKYTSGYWSKDSKAPYVAPIASIKDRILPEVNIAYPYLTISDFLEDTIVRMPYKGNEDAFFNGNFQGKESSFLLPLKSTFFSFFSVNELLNKHTGDGKNIFEIIENAGGGATVILRVPIANRKYIEYRRTYFEASEANPQTNDGNYIDKKMGIGVLPLIRLSENVKKHYRIALFDKGRNDIYLSFYLGSNPVIFDANTQHIIREKKDLENNICSIESYVIINDFDRINVKVGENTEGVIIPKFKELVGRQNFTFAVDFGTTNTHIEYVVNGSNKPKAFNMLPSEKQLQRLHIEYSDKDIQKAFEHNFIPSTIAENDEDYKFPMRTVLSKWKGTSKEKANIALAHGNIPFLYEKNTLPHYNEPCTELKWRNDDENYLVEMYIENVLILLRNKVAINGGAIEETKIVWFYPASMDKAKYDSLNKIWKEKYEMYFLGNSKSTEEEDDIKSKIKKNLISISESSAPWIYYNDKKGADSEVVTIDVGGGTTDVYIVEDRKPQMLLSFLFASNAIFGDGGIGSNTRWDSDCNGFINIYFNEFSNILKNNEMDELANTLNEISEKGNSPDIVAFMFALMTHNRAKQFKSLDLLDKLSNNAKLKYIFILYYGAVLYFIAKSMKSKGLKRPLTLAFSGNGSKTLRIVSHDNETIGEFAKLIFDGVYGKSIEKLSIIYENEPKKATSKGGILTQQSQTPNDIKSIKYMLLGEDLNKETTSKFSFEQITDDIQNNIISSVVEFVEFLFKLHSDNDNFFIKSLGADEEIIEEVYKYSINKKELSQSLKFALSKKNSNSEIEETLFFYPLIGILHELAQIISKK